MTADELIRRLRRLARRNGLVLTIESGRGSHLSLTLGNRRTSIPMHPGDIRIGTLKAIIKHLGIDEKDL